MRTPWIIAHRGASGHAPENTFAAFERAVQLGAGFIETDLQLTRDARFVAIHDATLDRTTNGKGAVREHTLAELRELDAGMWFDRQFMDQRIPTLEEILEFAKEQDIVFYLEIKYESAWGMHHALVGALGRAEIAARTIVLSFDPATLASVRRLEPAIMIGLLIEDAVGDPVKAALDVGARQLCPRADLVTPELVERAHRSDLHVVTWTVNDAERMRAAMEAGVDGIMTDLPDRLRAVVEDRMAKLSSR
ncbi:MAG TPA: glycerophosphodiester phosphodiesterase family protein [Candidatus Bathyarchaeia archaeon]|nr:glycerophosphodiester phosphodiesterase family protein [Candidatus Bathyarchaeia archaeon]